MALASTLQPANLKIYILQGLPHVGPALAVKLLEHFGSVEKVMAASEEDQL